MLKKDLIKAVATEANQTERATREIFDAIERVVARTIAAGQSVMLLGLGKLSVSRRGPKKARDMVTGKPVVVPERNVVLLRPSEGLSAAANQKV